MSRGIGKLQRDVLRVLDGTANWQESRTIADITARVFGPDHSESQRRSVARAVASLEARLMVKSAIQSTGSRKVPRTRTRTFTREVVEWLPSGEPVTAPLPEPRTVTKRLPDAVLPMPARHVWLWSPEREAAQQRMFAAAVAEDRRLGG